MNPQNRADQAFESWLDDGPTRMPEHLVDSIVAQLEETHQRKHWWLPGREQMNRMMVAVGGVAAIALVAAMGFYFLGRGGGGIGGVTTQPPTLAPTPMVSPSPAPTGAPTATPSPTRTPDAGLPLGPFGVSADGLPLTVVIPSPGWKWASDIGALQKGNYVSSVPEAAELFWSYESGTGFYVYGDPCQWESTTPAKPVTTVDDFAAALAAQPSRDASEPVDVTIDGHVGKALALHVPDDANLGECDQGQFASYGTTTESGPTRYHQGPGQIDDLVILDVSGRILIIDSMYRPDTSAELVDEMRGIVQSATFDTP
jgi:hypothetical protein